MSDALAAGRGCFVTGTDTEVGKTCVSTAILHCLAGAGIVAAGFKPVAAGGTRIGDSCVNDDVRALREASGIPLTDDEVGPFRFEEACAPHIAAELEGRSISVGAIVEAAGKIARRVEYLVVEGVGGFCVPFGPDESAADLAAGLHLPVLIVVGMRLGCLNHALLTAEAVRGRGLRVAGWVANHIDPDMRWAGRNVETLRDWMFTRHGARCLGTIPRLVDPGREAFASHLDRVRLLAAIYPSFDSRRLDGPGGDKP